ncbi:MAG: DEAD/DEAH box helicase family protein [Acetobacter sp.]|nr:DEAD/DEAH box helicase family protein [Acetobacter sp.]
MPPTTANTSTPNSLTRPQKGMHFQFDANQPHQIRAIDAIVNVFEGQDLNQTTFSLPALRALEQYGEQQGCFTELGVGNRLRLLDEELLSNVQRIQRANGLPIATKLPTRDFTLEMETGTGKTYVYLRALFEMHKRYGFTKFVIVVPSLAIKEGVLKFLEITKSHFQTLYENTPYDYFVYNSDKLTRIRSFALNHTLQIMVINIDAFRKSFTDPTRETSANIIHRYHDTMQGKPIEFIQATNPIVIIDEPQSVDTTENSAKAIASLNPLCSFRFSATHKDKHTMLYKLDSIDAYQQGLVKQIEVASLTTENDHNKAYIKLLSVDNTKSPITAKIEIDVRQKNGGVKRKTVTVKKGTDLFKISQGRALYDGYILGDIYCETGNEYIEFTSQEDILRLGEAIGDHRHDDTYKRLQIRKTIEEHLDKELRLTPREIKVLSLFFIDKVKSYRDYDAPDQKGKYAIMFEEEYTKAIKKSKYASLFQKVDTNTLAQEVHNGYFSQDKKGQSKDTDGKTKDDENTYNLIMRDKEKLLSFSSKLKFIFSHSALREGWDNPNVFQICTLNETTSTLKKRQEIGRGLRLCVNQKGDRITGADVNTLTVMTNESYEDFVQGLQKEIEEEEGIKFGVVAPHSFAHLVTKNTDGQEWPLGSEGSEKLYNYFLDKGYISRQGKILDSLKTDLQNNNLDLPPEVAPYKAEITTDLKKIADGLEIKNNANKHVIKINEKFDSAEFKELWDKIKFKTRYKVEFETEQLIKDCSEELKDRLQVGTPKFIDTTAKLEIERSGVRAQEDKKNIATIEARDYDLPNILDELQNKTNLKRQTIVDILLRSGQLESFKKNPQEFLKQACQFIETAQQKCLIDGIKYQKTGDFYRQELFENKELIGYLHKNMQEAKKSIYNYVVYDSKVESEFAKEFDKNDRVKVYAKLPNWFKIDTPLGTYNPDWAVLLEEEDGQERLYLVVETKGTANEKDLPPPQQKKIRCGKKHFDALQSGAKYEITDSFERLLERLENK